MRRRTKLALGLGVSSLLAGIAAIVADRLVAAEAARVAEVETAPEASVALVLGAGVWPDGQLSAVLEDRVITAVRLYRAGKVRKLLVSGDHGRAGYDEPAAMAAFAEAQGVPPEDIFLDHAGFDTYASLYRARHVFGVERALVVTQGFHLPRALYFARRLQIDATGVRADRRRYPARSWYALREVGARCKAVFLATLQPRPRFVGPPIPISGDGRVTRGAAAAGAARRPGPPPRPR